MSNQKLSLKMEEQNCKLENLTLYEPIDENILNKLIDSDLLQESFHSPFAEFFHENEKEQLIKYRKLIKNGKAVIKYNKVKNIPFGRVNPNNALGLFQIRRQIRHTLAKNTFIDVDIENAHPIILLHICKTNNIQCKYLEDYVKNRNKYLGKVMKLFNVTRDQAKKLFIQLMYFGSFESWCNDQHIDNPIHIKQIGKFKDEIQIIGKIIYDNNIDITKCIEKRKKQQKITNYNKIGSTVSYYLQEIENRLLETIFNYSVSHKIIKNNICVLCADGLMIEKDSYKEELLKTYSDLLKSKYDINVNITKKDMNEDYLDILDDHIITPENFLIKEYNYDNKLEIQKEDFKLSIMNDLFFEDIKIFGDKYKDEEIFSLTKSFKYFNHYHSHFYLSDKVHKMNGTVIEGYSSFGSTFKHLIISSGKFGDLTFEKVYMKSKYKQTYSTFNFEPNRQIKNDTYNLFTGFKYDSDNNDFNLDDINIYLNHIKFICNDNNEFYEYVLNWMAHIIQKPEKKTDVALVFFSLVEGVGKNAIFDVFEAILEGFTERFKDTSALTDKFNGEMMGKLFVIGDEINARATDVMNELKDIITRTKEKVEFKGKDKMLVNDYKNYVFTTNNSNVFKISNSDRRFALNECPLEIKDKQYYINYYSILKDDNILTQIFNFFKTKDISKFNPSNIVVTDYKKQLIMSNLPAYIKFMIDELDSILDEEIRTNDLYIQSVNYAKRNKLISTYTESLFTHQFKKVFGDYNYLQKKTQRSVYKFENLDKEDIKDLINEKYIKQ